MGKTLDEKLTGLRPARHAKIMARTETLIAEFPDRPPLALSGFRDVEAGLLAKASRTKKETPLKGRS